MQSPLSDPTIYPWRVRQGKNLICSDGVSRENWRISALTALFYKRQLVPKFCSNGFKINAKIR